MPAIPLPFVITLLLIILAMTSWMQLKAQGKWAYLFIGLNALTSAIVGMRWSFDMQALAKIQPILASLLPYSAWLCFAKVSNPRRFSVLHAVLPALIWIAVIQPVFLWLSVDILLTLLFIGYAIALLKDSFNKENILEDVRLSEWISAIRVQRIAGLILLFSAFIDALMTANINYFNGQHTHLILAMGYAVFIPILAGTVVIISSVTQPMTQQANPTELQINTKTAAELPSNSTNEMSTSEAQIIIQQFELLMQEKQSYLDPDLTLNRLARKLVIPARQVSSAVNLIYKQNISKVINSYRIEFAKHKLETTEESITQIYLSSGFHTKSNFNREFVRITKVTPSQFREGLKDNNRR